MSNMSTTIKHIHIVKPASPTPSGKMYLSESDQASAITHAPTIYIYRRPSSDQPFEALVQTLITSLGETLVDFYPVAGRLRYIPDAGGRVELECNSEGVTLIEAESDMKIEDLGDFSPSPLISSLIPRVDYLTQPIEETPLVLVQLTRFTCGGISVGFANSHTIMDGQSAMLFISEWCKRARGVVDPVRPFLDRTILKPSGGGGGVVDDGNGGDGGLHEDYTPPPLLVGRSDDREERRKETAVTTFQLSAKQVAKLKSKANLDNASPKPYTRYEAIAAHLWRCCSKARHHTASQATRVRIVTNISNRLKPPLPPAFFGNMVLRIGVEATSGDLINNPLGGVSALIRKKVGSVDDKYARDALAYLERQPDVTRFRNYHSLGCTKGEFFGNPNLEITSWLSLPLYGTDFGWGPEDYMGPGGIGFDGKFFVLPGLDEDGSVVILLRLHVECMDEFKKCLYEDM
uniref:Uncharacterized protein n=1 Tax=Kalanchoe fedtschenkoi TaxID=63787 RepID=A0A7N0TGT0_KALFE